MIGQARALFASKVAPWVAVAVVWLACALIAMSASASAAGGVHFQREAMTAFQSQLRRHEVHAVDLHPATATSKAQGHMHVLLNNGQHMTIAYAAGEQAQLVALVRANGTPVTIALAKPKTAKPAHHKLRYIAAGILIVVILVVAAVLLADRRRKLNQGGDGAPAVPSSGDAQ